MLEPIPILLQLHQPEKQRTPHLRFLAPALPERDLVQGPEPAALVEAEPTQVALQPEPELKQTALAQVEQEPGPVQAEQELAQVEPVQELVLEQALGPEAKDRSKHYFLKEKGLCFESFFF